MNRVAHQESGFTVIELIVTIVIIGILSALVIFSPKTFIISARDEERGDDVTSISRRLEQAYTSQDLGYPAYPSTAELTTDIANHTRTMTRISPDAFKGPSTSGTSSVVMATSTSTTSPAGAGTPTVSQYVYQPLTSAGALCTGNPSSGTPCVRFYLYYLKEGDSTPQIIKSTHQQ